MIELRKVSRIYGTGMAQVRALDQVDLAIGEADFVAIMGPSGSGKSTALNMIGCLDTPSSGQYFFAGVEAGELSRNQRALLRRHFLGFVFQGFNLLPRTSAVENVELPLIYRGVAVAERRARASEALAKVGLSGRERHAPSELSGGQQQRVAIARAIVTEPAVLLADEPTGNLDTRTSGEIMDLLTQLMDGVRTAKVQADIERLLRERRNIGPRSEDDFTVRDMKQIAETQTATTTVLTGLLGAVAAVSLIVGGIGIMNIMLVSVTERTREIGIRLAIGAQESQVLMQFLGEAVVLSLCGGLVGVSAGLGLAALVTQWMQLPFILDATIVLIAFGFSAAVGVVFGYFPARRAARMDPIEALRHE